MIRPSFSLDIALMWFGECVCAVFALICLQMMLLQTWLLGVIPVTVFFGFLLAGFLWAMRDRLRDRRREKLKLRLTSLAEERGAA